MNTRFARARWSGLTLLYIGIGIPSDYIMVRTSPADIFRRTAFPGGLQHCFELLHLIYDGVHHNVLHLTYDWEHHNVQGAIFARWRVCVARPRTPHRDKHKSFLSLSVDGYCGAVLRGVLGTRKGSVTGTWLWGGRYWTPVRSLRAVTWPTTVFYLLNCYPVGDNTG